MAIIMPQQRTAVAVSSTWLLLLLLHASQTTPTASARLGASFLSGDVSSVWEWLGRRTRTPQQAQHGQLSSDGYNTLEDNPLFANEYDTAQPPRDENAPLVEQFIVRFDTPNNATTSTSTSTPLTLAEIKVKADEAARLLGGTVQYIYQHVFAGAAIQIVRVPTRNETSDDNMASARTKKDITKDTTLPFVIERDGETLRSETTPTTTTPSTPIYTAANVRTQQRAPRPLDRLNQRSMPLDGAYEYAYDGTGVIVYIFDTGIRSTHVELSHVNISCGFSSIPLEQTGATNATNGLCDDLGGHGTHVAGVVASHTYGVAKQVQLVAIKVLDQYGRGAYSGIIAGLDYVISQRLAILVQNNNATLATSAPVIPPPMVINLSLGGVYSAAVNDAVQRAVAAGIVVVAAAGNTDSDACHASPASATAAITVGASQATKVSAYLVWTKTRDRRATYSNYGSCVDIFAWGTNVESCGIGSDTNVATRSGTSMAAPHVTGAVALYLHRTPNMTPDQVRLALLKDASQQQLLRIFQKRGSPNRMVNTNNIR